MSHAEAVHLSTELYYLVEKWLNLIIFRFKLLLLLLVDFNYL